MITSQQMRAARALLGIDQRQLAGLAGLSLPTIQRMEASDGQVRGVVDTLVKVIRALEVQGIELIGDNAPSTGRGRGVRLRENVEGKSAGNIASALFDQTEVDGTRG
ncbi:MAG: helix-turn-helix transcriptional regulator [Parasphingorhabdus sp.]|uniref:helix-turn-helix domain-containing protein n=1 Tax=Parasphingorhabdus sp. TaxID=2709688 RepID=UPI003001514D